MNLEANRSCKPLILPRREFLSSAGGGIGGLALLSLLAQDEARAGETGREPQATSHNPLSPRPSHFAGKAKRVISLFMFGGISHVDTFDPKVELDRQDGKSVAGRPGFDTMGRSAPGKLMKSPWTFHNYGKSGLPVSDLLPNIARCVDDIAFLRSIKSDSNNHVPAVYHMLTGSTVSGRPGLGSWVTYGLGTENQNLPAFVVMTDPRSLVGGGAGNWSSGFLPSNYQGVQFRSAGLPVLNLTPPKDVSPAQQREAIGFINRLNEEYLRDHPDEQEMAARIRAYELAYRMQSEATEAVHVARESAATQALYGLDAPETAGFGRQCLLARRLVERGVRFVQLYSGGGVFDQSWDAHNGIVHNHEMRGREIDKPIAGLIRDLKQRGLFEDTLLVFHTEFGRMPFTEGGSGRDHNPHVFTCWLAGAGVKGGTTFGESDEIGFKAGENPRTVFDLNATILHLLGLDHTRLTYRYSGRNMRLTEVSGEVIREILA
ncbi:MAG TPA: DUF1501 domain-containing protein [Chthonomonadaceae bacterium]|nr:DUF1501 domain-containing protein [Chthonomonadaceae bacterium]